MMTSFQTLKKYIRLFRSITFRTTYKPTYRVLEILKEETEEYTVRIQIINKNLTFFIKPEEILADDNFVDMFSPRDIRTLTYLGYLDINSPKYKILAQRYLKNNSILFALKEKGNNQVILKNASDILKEQEIISNLSADDAKTIGYVCASERIRL